MAEDLEQDDPVSELTGVLALAWGAAPAPRRGPKPELSIRRIVQAAVEIADADGLPAVSMASVSAELGFTTMSLYRYVASKDDLILLMQDQGLGEPPKKVDSPGPWRDELSAWARAAVAVYRAHPWLLDVPISGTPNTPNNLSWLDAGLAALRDTTLEHHERVWAVLLVSSHVRWQASVERGYRQAHLEREEGAREPDASDRLLRSLATEDRFPWLRDALTAGALDQTHGDPFDFGLARILDGLQSRMSTL
jgi:AcrR family transcriptional regulator